MSFPGRRLSLRENRGDALEKFAFQRRSHWKDANRRRGVLRPDTLEHRPLIDVWPDAILQRRDDLLHALIKIAVDVVGFLHRKRFQNLERMTSLLSLRDDRHDRRPGIARDPHRPRWQRRYLPEEFDRAPVLKVITIRNEDRAFVASQRAIGMAHTGRCRFNQHVSMRSAEMGNAIENKPRRCAAGHDCQREPVRIQRLTGEVEAPDMTGDKDHAVAAGSGLMNARHVPFDNLERLEKILLGEARDGDEINEVPRTRPEHGFHTGDHLLIGRSRPKGLANISLHIGAICRGDSIKQNAETIGDPHPNHSRDEPCHP